MATPSIFALAAVIIAIHGIAGAVAQAPAPGPAVATDCFTTLLNMSDCLSYVSAGSKDVKPDKHCCPELAGLVESSPSCLCQLLSDPNKVGLTIDVDRAMKLPSACNVSTPPVNLCSLLGFPVGSNSPGSAPAPAPGPGVQPLDDGGSATPGTPGSSGNRASSINRLHLAFLLGIALGFLSTLL
ncbi:non-specific lipid transfer protein GPI-anchored 2-like [Cucurbita moschata]|uniref:Non-specific lipid transfer protein GPI-anchored 2-like n=1 Tax=Cucurbita moschata TaxID=3662 RepID=A0A6J1H7Z8_CUCMO|nr:non-specific lipid transfer protein GPI-anchored 2-like [Cucurbita moschata]